MYSMNFNEFVRLGFISTTIKDFFLSGYSEFSISIPCKKYKKQQCNISVSFKQLYFEVSMWARNFKNTASKHGHLSKSEH